MIKYTLNNKLDLNIPWDDCCGWVSERGVHFILDHKTITSFWKRGDVSRNDVDIDDADTLAELISHSGVCTLDEVIKPLYSEDEVFCWKYNE